MTSKPLTYRSAGVSYSTLDPFKRLAQRGGIKTARRLLGVHDVAQSRGESAYVWEEKDCFRAMVMEGLGTKNLVADAMRKITSRTYYDAIAQDTVAMIVNDLITVGAAPQVVTAYFAVGDPRWFADEKRAKDLVRGWAKACRLAGAVWGGGETPTLKDIISPDTIDLAGSAAGIIRPKKRLLLGNRIRSGDAIVLVESSGIHANGLTLARAVAKKLDQGFATKLADGSMYGEALLVPTYVYAGLVNALFDAGVVLHYLVNITGHGWRKLMRANRRLTYVIDTILPVPVLFKFLQQRACLNDREMYATFNMGAGFALYLPAQYVPKVVAIAKTCGFQAWHAGHVEQGSKKVIIRPGNILFEQDSLQIR